MYIDEGRSGFKMKSEMKKLGKEDGLAVGELGVDDVNRL